MKVQFATSAIALAVALGMAACNTDTPTSPQMSAPETGALDRSGPKSRDQQLSFAVAGPLTDAAGAVVANFAGTMNVTKFGFNEATHQLLVTGVLNGVVTYVDGVTAPVTLNQTVTMPATLRKGDVASASSIYHLASASCGILLLDLGPLHLDLLGLVIDLNEVILDITAQTGANNLLGNLLCALTGLFDIPGAIAGIINLINSINNLLSGIGGLAAPAVSASPLYISHGVVAFLRSA
jgi:hypothetical protein